MESFISGKTYMLKGQRETESHSIITAVTSGRDYVLVFGRSRFIA